MLATLQDHESKLLGDQIETAWNSELKNSKHPSLWRVNVRIGWKDFTYLSIVFLVSEISR